MHPLLISFRDRDDIDTGAETIALNEFGHQGLMHDEEFGLVYNRARMLHPTQGRFMQRDPLGYVDGATLYGYEQSSPHNLDPLGLDSGFGPTTPAEHEYWAQQRAENERRQAERERLERETLISIAHRWNRAILDAEFRAQIAKNMLCCDCWTPDERERLLLQLDFEIKAADRMRKELNAIINPEATPANWDRIAPVYGSAMDGADAFADGDILMGMVHFSLAVSDLLGIKALYAAGAKALGKAGAKTAAKVECTSGLAQVTVNRSKGIAAVDDFIAHAEANGMSVVGREVSVQTPFGLRIYDVVLEDALGALQGVEIKSSERAFKCFGN